MLLISFFIIIPLAGFARSGCCSHHGGVCGCGCCDGTDLSATCAPYYPQCNRAPNIDYTPPVKYNIPSATDKTTNYNLPTSSDTSKKEQNDNSAIYGIGILGLGGAIAYYYFKKKK